MYLSWPELNLFRDSYLFAFAARKRRFSCVTPAMLFEVTRVTKLSAAVVAGEPGRVGVDEQVVVQAVLTGEHRLTLVALVRPKE
jgi:hypothetical protein